MNFCATVTTQPHENTICAFIHGLDTNEIETFIQRLVYDGRFSRFPSLVPTILLDMRLDVATRNTERTVLLVQEIERDTGMDPQWTTSSSADAERLEKIHRIKTDLEFDVKIHDLTTVTARLSYYTHICKVHLHMPGKLNEINANTVEAAPQVEKDEFKRLEILMRSNNAHLHAYLEGTMIRTEALLPRVQAQRDTVSGYRPGPEASRSK